MNIFLMALLITSLGMSAVILSLMLLNKLLAGKIHSSVKYYVWLIILVGLLIPFRPNISVPFKPIPIPISKSFDVLCEDLNRVDTVNENGQSVTAISPIAEKPILPYAFILFALWAAGTLSILLFNIRAYRKFSSSVRRWGVEVEDENMLSIMRKAMENMGLTGKRIAVKTYMLTSSPMLVGFLKPTILLPENEISPDELEYIFRHELTHYKRYDLWINLLILLTQAVHWFNPIVYFMANVIRSDCEASCDEMTLVGSGEEIRKHYGETILGFISSGNAKIPVLSTYFYGRSNYMKKRLHSIIDTSRKNSWLAIPCVMAITMATIMSGSMFAVAKDTQQQYIGEAKAKSIAIQNVGDGIVTDCSLYRDQNTGTLIYRIHIANEQCEHQIELDAATGAVYKIEQVLTQRAMPSAPPPTPNSPVITPGQANPGVYGYPQIQANNIGKAVANKIGKTVSNLFPGVYGYPQTQANITPEIAQSTALARVGGGKIARTETKYPRHGGMEYKVIVVNGDYKYDVHINAFDGSVINYKMDQITKLGPHTYYSNATPNISADRAKSIAIQIAGSGIVTDCKLDYKKHIGILIYHIHVANGQSEYCIELDASTGTAYKAEQRYKQ